MVVSALRTPCNQLHSQLQGDIMVTCALQLIALPCCTCMY